MKNLFQWKKTKGVVFQIGIRIIAGIVIAGAAIVTVYFSRTPYGQGLKEGDVSRTTIYAPVDFKYRIGIDEEKTAQERQSQAEAIDEVYEIDAAANQELINQINQTFDRIYAIKALNSDVDIEKVKLEQKVEMATGDLKSFLADADLAGTKIKTINLLKEILGQGIVSAAQQKELAKSGHQSITIKKLDAQELRTAIEKLSTLDKIRQEMELLSQNLLPENRKLRIAVINLVKQVLTPNLRLNQELTNKMRQAAYDKAPLQYKFKEVKKGELIIAKGERANKEHLQKIEEMFLLQVKVNRLMFFCGATILTLLFLGIVVFYLRLYAPKVFLDLRKLTLVGTLFILILIIAKMIALSSLPSYAIPTAIASILIAMLIGPRLAIVITMAISIFVGIIAGDKLNIACVSFVGGIVGVLSIQGARRRSQILVTGLFVGLANFACICAIELLHGLNYPLLFREGFWGIASGIGTGIIITGLLPVFEYLFNMVTNISLLELSDLNHPLLKEMVFKAPGTYHHSLIVGNLAEAACEAIGSNALLARVGSYFHDIGKTEKAEYFSENQMGAAKKKHDRLTPSMSSLIITNHVKDGVELARKYKLNQAIVNFIEQHHGTSLIYYFYQRALEKVEDEETLQEEGFRYPGPKPQTKETAVALLADSAEASSRALNDPTPARIKGLVRKIINNKFIDNQLDQCDLTLKDLEIIADCFTRILTGIFHSRVEYDDSEKTKAENRNKKPSEKDKSQ